MRAARPHARRSRGTGEVGALGRWRARARDGLHPLALALLALACATHPPATGAVRDVEVEARTLEAVKSPQTWLTDGSIGQARAEPRARRGNGGLVRPVLRAEKTVQATIKGHAVRLTALAEEAGARQAHLARIGGIVLLGAWLERSASTLAQISAAPGSGQPRAWIRGTLADAANRVAGRPRTRSFDLAVLGAGRMAASPARVSVARVHRPEAPIMPLPGAIVRTFEERSSGAPRPGFVIAATPGQAVAAPEDGRVAFAGPFKSYGLLLIIEHGREYHTLLWGFSRIDVASGETVRTGQAVGIVGTDSSIPELHVELRRNGRPVNPMPWLAASTSGIRG
jgi:murein DD-endopeptidase MepM/ murein hydrolase activator NlpD